MLIINNLKTFLSFLDQRQKFRFYLIILICLFQSILEAFGVGIVIPFLSLLTKPNNTNFFFINDIKNFEFISGISDFQIIIIAITIFFIFFLFKTIFLCFSIKKIYNFCFDIQESLKQKVFNNSIKLEYQNFLKESSSKLILDISSSISSFTQFFTIPLLTLISEILILLSILILLIFFEFKGFLVLSFFLFFSIMLFYKIIGKSLKELGVKKENMSQQQLKILNNAIGNIKITKLHNLENFYIKSFANSNSNSAKIESIFYTLQNIPRVSLEFFGFIALTILIITLIATSQDNLKIVSTVGLFAAAGFKIIPSINRIIFALQAQKYSKSIVENLKIEQSKFKNLEIKDHTLSKNNISFNYKINLSNIYFKYENTNNFILKDFNLLIEANECIGITGKSGSGKSTFLDILTGLLKPTRGNIFVDDKKQFLDNPSWRNIIAYVPQNNYLLKQDIITNIALAVNKADIDNDLISEIINITELSNTLNMRGTDIEGGLSGGQIQRIAIARALYRKPKILIMDEPTSALDSETEHNIMTSINKISGKLTLIIVSHRMSALKYCSKIYEFKDYNLRNIKT